MNALKERELIEALAALEHEQWMHWSHELSQSEELSLTRLRRWRMLWVPYDQLPVQVQEADRVCARKVLRVLREKGVIA